VICQIIAKSREPAVPILTRPIVVFMTLEFIASL
jgi:hypothetical protein